MFCFPINEFAKEVLLKTGWISEWVNCNCCLSVSIILITLFLFKFLSLIVELDNTFFGTDNLGKLGKSAEVIGAQAAQEFIKQASSNACLDKNTADQILPYMAVLPGKSQITVSEITSHCKTNIWLIEKFMKSGKFAIAPDLNDNPYNHPGTFPNGRFHCDG